MESMRDQTIRDRLHSLLRRLRLGAGAFFIVWAGFVLLYVFTGQSILQEEDRIRTTEKIENSFLSLQEPLIVYLETQSPSQKIRFDTILQETLARMPAGSGILAENRSRLFAERVRGMIFQVQALGNALFVPGITPGARQQLTLSLTNLLFEAVHNDIHPFLRHLRTRESRTIHRIVLVILFNLLFFVSEIVLFLWLEGLLKELMENAVLKPLERLAVWALSVAKGDSPDSFSPESIPKDAEMRDLVESINMMKDSLVMALGQTRRKLQHNELLSMIIQASGFMSREQDVIDVSRQALMTVFEDETVEIHFNLRKEEGIDECWAIRKGGLISDQDWSGLVRCHQCEHAQEGRTYLCSPIQSAEETLGTITLRSGTRIDWTDEDRTFLRDVAAHVGMALSKLRLLHRHRNEAILDPLTGLYNRRYLEDFFQRVSSLMRRHGKPHSFIMLDIDHFKEINDAHGHEAGDKVLKEVSDIIRGSMRQGEDMPARIGGEEFALIVHGGREQAFVVAEKIRKKVSENWGPSRGLNVSISAGISEFAPDSVLSGVMKEADEALYRAKKEGRNRTVISGESKGPD